MNLFRNLRWTAARIIGPQRRSQDVDTGARPVSKVNGFLALPLPPFSHLEAVDKEGKEQDRSEIVRPVEEVIGEGTTLPPALAPEIADR